jgi:hypothetical protein
VGHLVRPKIIRLLKISKIDIINYIIINNIRYVLILDLCHDPRYLRYSTDESYRNVRFVLSFLGLMVEWKSRTL